MKIIVNADDLGISSEVNAEILRLMRAGRVTSATILANGAAMEAAAQAARELPQCSFGVHLNASEFVPLTRQEELAPLLDDRGAFAGDRVRSMKVTAGLRAAIFREWCTQVERMQSVGCRISHLDGHHHIHTVPSLFPVLKKVQRRFGIRKVRITTNVFEPGRIPLLRRRVLKALWNCALRSWYRTQTVDGFCSLETFERAAFNGNGLGTIELMVHPGGAGFVAENQLLESNWMQWVPGGADLINYHDL